MSHPSTGFYSIDFGFQVNDRLFMAQPAFGSASSVAQLFVVSEPATQISLGPTNSSGLVNNPFFVFIF